MPVLINCRRIHWPALLPRHHAAPTPAEKERKYKRRKSHSRSPPYKKAKESKSKKEKDTLSSGSDLMFGEDAQAKAQPKVTARKRGPTSKLLRADSSSAPSTRASYSMAQRLGMAYQQPKAKKKRSK